MSITFMSGCGVVPVPKVVTSGSRLRTIVVGQRKHIFYLKTEGLETIFHATLSSP